MGRRGVLGLAFQWTISRVESRIEKASLLYFIYIIIENKINL